MKKTTAITTLLIGSLTFAAASQAQNRPSEQPVWPALTVEQALDAANNIKPASYSAIDLLEGKNGQWVYVAETDSASNDAVLILDANTGKDITASYMTSKHSLKEAIASVKSAFDGRVVSAETTVTDELTTGYLIVLEQQEQGLTEVLVDGNTLKVLATETGHDEAFDEQDWDEEKY